LKTRIGEARVAAFFKSPEDIRSHVVEALVRLAKEFETAEAGDAAASAAAKLRRKTSIPAPPEPYIAHPYTLLQLRDLVGRQAELNALTDWVANSASPAFGACSASSRLAAWARARSLGNGSTRSRPTR
jgi:hypothetical protein